MSWLKVSLLAVCIVFLAILVYALPPSLTGLNAVQQVQQNSVQTITPQGLTQMQGNPVNFYCCVDSGNSCIPSTSNSACMNSGPFASPYSNAECSFTASQSFGDYSARCIVVDSVSKQKSGVKGIAFSIVSKPAAEPCSRSLFANTYCNPDGSKTSEISADATNYPDANKVFKPIEKTVRPVDKQKALASKNPEVQRTANFDSEVESGLFRLLVKANPSDENAVTFEYNNYLISFRILELYFEGTGKQSIGSASLKPGVHSRIKNTVKFSNVFSNSIDLEYDYQNTGMKERLVVKSFSALPSASSKPDLVLKESFRIPKGLKMIVEGKEFNGVRTATNKKIKFIDSQGVEQFFIPSPKAWDSAGNLTTLSYVLEQQGNEVLIYSKTPYAWISSQQRKFPVTIDTSVNLSVGTAGEDGYVTHSSGLSAEVPFDTYACDNTSASLTGGSYYSYVDGYNYEYDYYDSFFSFNTSNIPDNSPISSVALKLYSESTNISTALNVKGFSIAANDCSIDGTNLFSSINNGTSFLAGTTGFNTVSQYNQVSLNSAAAVSLFNALPTDDFNVGLTSSDYYSNSFTSAEGVNTPVLVVTYVSGISSATPVIDYNSEYALNANWGASKISWADATDETGYAVWRKTLGGNFSKASGTLAANTTDFSDLNINDNTTYIYKVETLGAGGDANSAQDLNITLDRSGPSVPSSVVLSTPGSGKNMHVDLNWFESDDNSSYAPLLDQNVLGYWRFEEASGTKSYDSSGNGNDGTVNSAVLNVAGRIGKGISVAGTANQHVDVGDINGIDKNLTISYWAFPTNYTAQRQNVIDKSYSGEFSLTHGLTGAWSNLYFYQGFGTTFPTQYMQCSWTNVFTDNNKWYNITLVRSISDTNTIKLYVNGILKTSSCTAWVHPVDTLAPIKIGDGYASNGFIGSIDEVIILNKAISEADVNKIYAIGSRKYGLERQVNSSTDWTPVNGYYQEFSYANATDIASLPNWTKDTADGSVYKILQNKLVMYHPAAAPDAALDYALYTLPNAITGNAIVEFDMNIADSDNWDFMFAAGDSSFSTNTNASLWSSINNESWQAWNSTWGVIKAGLTVGSTYHVKVIFDQSSKKTKFYINEMLYKETAYPNASTTGLKKLWFGNYGYGTVNTSWFVDNLKVSPLLDTNTFADTNAADINAPSAPLAGMIETVSISNGGSGYSVGELLTIADGIDGTVIVNTVNSGAITEISINAAGSGYSVGVHSTTGGSGTGATINVLTTTGITVGNAGSTTLDVNYVIVSDIGTTYGYSLTAFDDFGNESNLVRNGGLERWSNGAGSVPDYWTLDGNLGTTHAYGESSPNSGNHSFYLNTGVCQSGDCTVYFYQTFPGESDVDYRMTGYNKTIGGSTGSGLFGVLPSGHSTGSGGNCLYYSNWPSAFSKHACTTNSGGGVSLMEAVAAGMYTTNSVSVFGYVDDVKVWRVYSATVTSGVKNYFIDCISGPGCSDSNSQFDDYNNSATGLHLTGLTPNSQYCFKVKAIDNADNNSALSTQVCGTTSAATVPTIQTDVNSSYALNSSLGGVRISWGSIAGVTGFDVWRSSDYNASWQKIVSNTSNFDYNDLGVSDNNSLFYKISSHYPGLDVNSVIDANITADRTSPAASADLNVWGSPADYNNGDSSKAGITGGLVGYWRFEDLNADTNKTSDLSGNGDNGTLTNFACNVLDCSSTSGWVSSGQVGKAASLDGSNDFVSVPNNSVLSPTSQVTVSAWVKTTMSSVTYGPAIAAKGTSSYSLTTGEYSAATPRATGFVYIGGVWKYLRGNTAINDGQWHHVAMTYDGAYLRVFKDGVSDATPLSATGSISVDTGALTIGSYSSGRFQGSIDEVKVFNRALSAQEIALDYNAGLAKKSASWATVNWQEATDAGNLGPVDKNLVGYWRFQEGSGTVANDSSGRGISGTLTNFANVTLDFNSQSGWVSNGRKGNGLVFDGQNDFVSLPVSSDLNFDSNRSNNNFTVSVWAFRTSTATNQRIFTKPNGTTGGYGMYVSSASGQIQVYTREGASTSYFTTTAGIPLNQWTNIAWVYDDINAPGNKRVYFNGIQQAGSEITPGRRISGFNGNVIIGCYDASAIQCFKGPIDEVMVFDRNLPVNDVNVLYLKGLLKYSLLRGTIDSDVSTSMVVDLNSTVFSDFNAVDLNAPVTPSKPSVGAATTSSLDVNWTAGTDQGSLYYYRVKAKDYEGNDANNYSAVDSNTVTSGVWQYWVVDLNQGSKLYGPYVGLGASITGLSAGSQHCFKVKAQDYADNNSALSDLNCFSAVALTPADVNVDVNSSYALNSSLGGLHVYWSAVAGASSYDLWRSADYNSTWQKLLNASSNLDYNDLGMSDNNTLFYKVTAHDGVDVNSDAAGMIDVNITADRTAPAASSDLNVSSSSSGLVGCWHFEEGSGSTAFDCSGNGNDLHFGTSAPAWSASKVAGDHALDFDDGNYADAVDSNSLRLGKTFTISAWVFRQSDSGTYERIIGKSGTANNGFDYYLQIGTDDSAQVGFMNSSATGYYLASTSSFPLGSWTHFVGIFNGTKFEIYLNGVLNNSGYSGTNNPSGISPRQSANPLNIGRLMSSSTWYYNDNFIIDEVKIYNRVLSSKEVSLDYNQGLSGLFSQWIMANWIESTDAGNLGPVDKNLVGYWRFQEGTGTTAYDSSGIGNTGTFPGAAANPTWTTAGRKGNALSFDGGDYVNVGTNSSLNTSVFTYSAWINPSGSTTRTIKGNSATSGGPQFRLETDNRLGLIKQDVAVIGNSTSTVTNGVWNHVAVTYDSSGNYVFYINGVNAGSGTSLQALTFSTHRIGGRASTEYFNGLIDEVQIWNKVLASSDINALYQKGSLKYSLLRGDVSTDVNTSMAVDLNSIEFYDSNAVDLNAPRTPSVPSVGSATVSSLDVNWSAVVDGGSTYYYRVKAKDYEGNDSNEWSGIDSNIVTSGVWNYWLVDLNNSSLLYGPYSGLGTVITGLSSGSQHCFRLKAQDYADNNSSMSSLACGSVIPASLTLSSSSHPSEATWYNSASVSMQTAGTFDHINYYVSQNASETADTIRTSGTYDLDGTFTVSLAASGIWYVHAVALNDQNQGSTTDSFQINYDGTNPTATSIAVSSWSGGVSGYTSNAAPPLSITASDTGGSGLDKMYLSCDANTWQEFAYSASTSSFNIKTGSGCTNAEGDKNVYLKVKDTAGNYSGTVQTSQFVLDETDPTGSSISVDSGSWTGLANYTNDSTPQFNISSTGAYQMKYSCNAVDYSSYESYATTKTNWDIKPAVLTNGCSTTDGSRTVYAVFKDQAGNEATAVNTGAFTLDQVAPVPSNSTPANGFRYSSPDPSLTSTNVETTAGLWKCYARIGTANPPSTTLRIVEGSISSNTCTFTGYSALSEGTYYWDVNAVDKAGNWSSGYSTATSIVRDNTAPTVPSTFIIENDSTAPYWDKVNNSKTELGFTALESSETCKWNLTSVAYASMGNSCTVNGTDVNCAFGSLGQTSTAGQYLNRYHACIDDVNNAYATQGISFGIDWTAPTTSDDSNTEVHVPTYTVTLAESDNASNAGSDITTVYCTDNVNSCTPSTGIDNSGTINFTSANRGTRYLKYYSTDLAGNVQTTVSKTININQLPSFTSADANVGNANPVLKGGAKVLISTVASDADAGQTLNLFVCKINDATSSGCGAGGTYCSATGASSNPSCILTAESDNTSHTWYAYVFDSLNEGSSSNPRSGSFTSDSNAPCIAPSNPADASGTSNNKPSLTGITAPGVIDLASCKLQIATDANFATIVSGFDGADGNASTGNTCTFNTPTALADGTYYWRMSGTDNVGNYCTYDGNRSLTVDTQVLSTSLVSIAGDSSSPYWDTVNDSQTAIVISGESGMFCKWGTQDVAWSSMSNDNNCSVAGSNATCNLGSLTQRGISTTHYISCRDSVGNEQTSAQNIDATFGIDWTLPSACQTSITSAVTATHVSSPADIETSVLSDNVSLDTTSCQYTLNGTDWNAGTWNSGSSKCVDNAIVLNDGSNAVNYRISDSAGNLRACTAITRTKDNTAPTGMALGFGTITLTSITVAVSGASDSGAGLNATPYYFDADNGSRNSGWTASASWTDSSLDVNSTHSYKVKARDALGNESAFTAVQSKFTLANIPGTPTLSSAGSTSMNVTLDVNSNPAGTQFAIYDLNASKWVQSNGSEGAGIVWQKNSDWGTKTITGLLANTEHCFKAKARNGDLNQTGLSQQACLSTSSYYVKTIVKDVNGYFSTTNYSQWIPSWTNTDVNAKLICSGGSSQYQVLSFGGSTTPWNDFIGADKNITYTSSSLQFNGSSFTLLSGYNEGTINIKATSSGSPVWNHYSAWIEPYTFNPNYLGVGVSYRTASTRAGLDSETFSSEFPSNYMLNELSANWVEFKIRLYRNSAYGSTTTDSISLKGFFAEYITGSINSSTSCQATYYRKDLDSSDSESFQASGDLYHNNKYWSLLGADKNVLFTQDGNYALEFFSQSTSDQNESPQKINVLIKKSLDTISMGDFCTGIQDRLSLNLDWNASTAVDGVYKYRIYASTSSSFESKILVFESGTATSSSLSLVDMNMQTCGDGKCYYGENCPADSYNCNFGEICSNGCQAQTSVTFNTSSSGTCTPGTNNSSLDAYCRQLFGANYACIDGCVPTSNNMFSSVDWNTTSNTSSSSGYCGDGFCDLNEFCPKDNSYCASGLVCNYGCRQSSSTNVCGDGTCSSMEHCSADNSNCPAGYACISGCMPTSSSSYVDYFTPKYQLASGSRNAAQTCGDGFCETLTSRKKSDGITNFSNSLQGALIDEYCPFDNRYCSANGFTNGICAGGCKTPSSLSSSYTTIKCGDGICGIGENCPLDNAACSTGEACISGCLPASGTIISNPSSTRFDPYKGSYDGKMWFMLEVETNTGTRTLSAPQQCEIDYESPFRIPYSSGRNLQKAIDGRTIDFNIAANSIIAGADANIIIDVNNAPPSFTRGSLLKAFDLEADINVAFSTPAKFKVDFNRQALPCWPSCTTADANKLSLYDYNADTNSWTKLPTIVDWDNNQMWADLNRI